MSQPYYPPYAPPPPEHPRAMTALVLGILGLVVCQVCAPFAWKIGKDAMTEIDASVGRWSGRGQAQAGYILGVIGTILLILVAALLFVTFGLALLSALLTTTATTG